MSDPQIAALQRALRSGDHIQAWADFLTSYSPVVLQAVRRSIWDNEKAADCFVFVCEQLCARGYRRLLKYKPESGTSFVTWLRVVVRNLALDWHRRQSGRPRVFESVARMTLLHQEVYRLRYQERRSLDEVHVLLRQRFPDLSEEAVGHADAELRQSISPHQEWLLASQRAGTVSLDASDPAEGPPPDVADPSPGPEELAISSEEWQRLARGLARLDPSERVLLQLRYGQGVTLTKLARFVGLPDAQTADRRVRAILDRLKKEFL